MADVQAPNKPGSPPNGIEEGHDSGVDESTQSKENGEVVKPSKTSAPRKRQSRPPEASPLRRVSASSVERKLPMNKIEVGKTPSPNIKSVKSRIGSLDNTKHRPTGGNVKIESRKLDFSTTSSRIAATNEGYTPKGGDKKIETVKLTWSADSRVGSLGNKDHKPGGGKKAIETQKLNFKEKAKSKIGSKDNIKHKAGGGEIEIVDEKLAFKDKASSKVGSLDKVQHKAGGGNKKIFDDKEYLKQMQTASPCKTPTSKTSSGTQEQNFDEEKAEKKSQNLQNEDCSSEN